jgi:hypothetical protein
VRRSGHDQHDVLARRDAAEPMNDGEALQRPARQRLVGVTADFASAMPG